MLGLLIGEGAAGFVELPRAGPKLAGVTGAVTFQLFTTGAGGGGGDAFNAFCEGAGGASRLFAEGTNERAGGVEIEEPIASLLVDGSCPSAGKSVGGSALVEVSTSGVVQVWRFATITGRGEGAGGGASKRRDAWLEIFLGDSARRSLDSGVFVERRLVEAAGLGVNVASVAFMGAWSRWGRAESSALGPSIDCRQLTELSAFSATSLELCACEPSVRRATTLFAGAKDGCDESG